MEDVGFSAFIAFDHMEGIFLFRRQRQGFIRFKRRQDVCRPCRMLLPTGKARRSQAAHEVTRIALGLEVGSRRRSLFFQFRQ